MLDNEAENQARFSNITKAFLVSELSKKRVAQETISIVSCLASTIHSSKVTEYYFVKSPQCTSFCPFHLGLVFIDLLHNSNSPSALWIMIGKGGTDE